MLRYATLLFYALAGISSLSFCSLPQKNKFSHCFVSEKVSMSMDIPEVDGLSILPQRLPAISKSRQPLSTLTVNQLVRLTHISIPSAPIAKLSYSPDSQTLAISSNLAGARSTTYVATRSTGLKSLRLTQDGLSWTHTWLNNNILATGVRFTTEYWHVKYQERFCQSTDVTDSLSHMEFSTTGGFLAVASDDRHIRLIRLADGEIFQDFITEWPALDLAISPNADTIVAPLSDDTYMLWNIKTGRQLWNAEFPTGPVSAIAFNPSGASIAVGGWPVRLIDSRTGNLLHELSGSTPTVRQLSFSPDGELVIASTGKSIVIWRTRDGVLLREITQPNGFRFFALSPDSRELAISNREGNEIQFWGVVAQP